MIAPTMGMKHGYIDEEDTPPTAGPPAIRRFRLIGGERVYLPSALAAWLESTYPRSEEIFFLERGFLRKVHWVGDEYALRLDLAEGRIDRADIGKVRVDPLIPIDGWYPMSGRFFHYAPGLGNVQKYFRDEGRPDLAALLTIDQCLERWRVEGLCLAERPDTGHEHVWCRRPSHHRSSHVPACPPCVLLRDDAMRLSHLLGLDESIDPSSP